jgi:hypothetical protein
MRLEDLDDGMLGGNQFSLDLCMDIGAERGIADHLSVSRKNIAVLRTESFPGIRTCLFDFSPGHVQSLVEP